MDAENEPQKEREQNKTLGCESVSYAGLAIWIVCFIDQPPQPDPHHTRTCRNSWTSSISDARNRSLMRQTPSCSRWSSSVSSRRIQASTGSKKKKNTLHHPPALLCLSLSLSPLHWPLPLSRSRHQSSSRRPWPRRGTLPAPAAANPPASSRSLRARNGA